MADAYLTWWTSIEVDLRKSLVINAMRDHGAMHSLIRNAFEAGLSSATPPSPSTAPEVDERAAFERHEHASNLRRVGVERDGSGGWYENPCVQSAWEGWQARAALASRPAEVDDEGLPPLPKGRYAWEYSGGVVYDEDEFRQGQRDAVAADRARRAAAGGGQ